MRASFGTGQVRPKERRMKTSPLIVLSLLLAAGTSLAHPPGDHVEQRLDHRGDRIEQRPDQRGDRIDHRLDRRGARFARRH
jgi:hypothetical protein